MDDSTVLTALERVEYQLRQLVRLQLGPILRSELQNDFDKDLFEMTGRLTRRQIQTKLKCSPNRVSDKWNDSERLGIVVKDGQGYRKVV